MRLDPSISLTLILGLHEHGAPCLERGDAERRGFALDARDEAALAGRDDLTLVGLIRLEDVVERALAVNVVVELCVRR